jgi:hypothetical protein
MSMQDLNIRFLIVLLIVAGGVRAQGESSNALMSALLRLTTGRQIECEVLAREGATVRIQRPFGRGMAKEGYQVEQIEGLYFPRPELLDSETQDIAAVVAEYKRWQPFADIKGNWAAPVGLQLAQLLEEAGEYEQARELYEQHASSLFFAELSRAARVRATICAAQLGINSNVFDRLTNVWSIAESDAERAELTYFIGCGRAALGDPVDGLFALLRNVVFYHAQGNWEPRSLAAALPLYARLDRGDEYRATIGTLLRRFPESVYAEYATNCLVQLDTASNLAELVEFTLQSHGVE